MNPFGRPAPADTPKDHWGLTELSKRLPEKAEHTRDRKHSSPTLAYFCVTVDAAFRVRVATARRSKGPEEPGSHLLLLVRLRRHLDTEEVIDMRHIRHLGSAALVVLALAAIGAGSASAAQFRHEAIENAKVKATNTNNHVFTAGPIGSITCTSATFTGVAYLPSPQKTLEVEPAYSGCSFLGVVGTVKVNTEGCKYKFNEPTGSGPFTGTVDVVCPEGKKINFEAEGCKIEVGSQTGLKTVSYKNLASSVEVTANVTGITYKAGLTCIGATGEHSDGTYSGTANATAEDQLTKETVRAYIE
jgi:hypothetical protein